MKNKKIILYLLLPITIAIWGMVIFSFMGKMKTDKTRHSETWQKNDLPEVLRTRDTLVLIANYRDPFLGNSSAGNKRTTPVNPAPRKKAFADKRKIEKPVPWPEIEFGGVIINTHEGKNTAMVKLNGKEYLAHAGEEVNGVAFLSIHRDSIRVAYMKDQKTIVKPQ